MLNRKLDRRQMLGLCGVMLAASALGARVIFGGRPFVRIRTLAPTPVDPTLGWKFFTPSEAASVEAIVDRLIPADGLGIGGREAGCALFIDRQLAGSYGSSATWYLSGPMRPGTPQQGPQHTDTLGERYRRGLAALDRHCRFANGKGFDGQDVAEQDRTLSGLENGTLRLDGTSGPELFAQLLKNTREGYFADPLYGGNANMEGWRLLGFPGARYDYRDMIARRGEDLNLAPISIFGGASAGKRA